MSQITLTQYVNQQRAKAEERALKAERLLLLMHSCVPVILECPPLPLSPTELRILNERKVVAYQVYRGMHATVTSYSQGYWGPGVTPAVDQETLNALSSKARKALSDRVWAAISSTQNTERLLQGRWAVVELLGIVREVFADVLLVELNRADASGEHPKYPELPGDLLPSRYDTRHLLKGLVRYQTAVAIAGTAPCWLEVPGVHHRQTRVERSGTGSQEIVKWYVSGDRG